MGIAEQGPLVPLGSPIYHGTSLEPSRRSVIEKILTKKDRALSSTGIPVSLM